MEEASPGGSLGVQVQSVDKSRLELFWASQTLLLPSSLATEPEPLPHFLTLHTSFQPDDTKTTSYQNFDPFLCTNRGPFIPFYHMFICKSLAFMLMKCSHRFFFISDSVYFFSSICNNG